MEQSILETLLLLLLLSHLKQRCIIPHNNSSMLAVNQQFRKVAYSTMYNINISAYYYQIIHKGNSVFTRIFLAIFKLKIYTRNLCWVLLFGHNWWKGTHETFMSLCSIMRKSRQTVEKDSLGTCSVKVELGLFVSLFTKKVDHQNPSLLYLWRLWLCAAVGIYLA